MRLLLLFLMIILNSCGMSPKSNIDCEQYYWNVHKNEPLIYKVIYSDLKLETSLEFENDVDTQYSLIYNLAHEKQNEANKFIVLSRRMNSDKLIDVSIVNKQIDPLSLNGEYGYDVYRVIMDIYGNITQKQLDPRVSNLVELFLKLGCFSSTDSTFRNVDFNAFSPTMASTLEIEINNVVRVTEISALKSRFKYDFRQKFQGLANSDTVNSVFRLKAYSDYLSETEQLDGFYGYAELLDIFGEKHKYILGLVPVDSDSVLTNLHYSNGSR